jgi:hypothetical protein
MTNYLKYYSRFRQTHALFMMLFASYFFKKAEVYLDSIFYLIMVVVSATEDANEIKGNFLFLFFMTI